MSCGDSKLSLAEGVLASKRNQETVFDTQLVEEAWQFLLTILSPFYHRRLKLSQWCERLSKLVDIFSF